MTFKREIYDENLENIFNNSVIKNYIFVRLWYTVIQGKLVLKYLIASYSLAFLLNNFTIFQAGLLTSC